MNALLVGRDEPWPGTGSPILIIDPDEASRSLIAGLLQDRGLHTIAVSGRQDLLLLSDDGRPDLVVLDLDHWAGSDLLGDLLARPRQLAVIGIDARTELDRVLALELGADDCLSMPTSPRELLARIRAVLRRRGGIRPAECIPQRRRYCFGPWQLDPDTGTLTHSDGRTPALSKSEHALLLAFLKAPRRPLSRAQLLQAVRLHEDALEKSISLEDPAAASEIGGRSSRSPHHPNRARLRLCLRATRHHGVIRRHPGHREG